MKPVTHIGFLVFLLATLSPANDSQRTWQSGTLLYVVTENFPIRASQPNAGRIDTGDLSLLRTPQINESRYSLDSGDFIWVATRLGRYSDFKVTFRQPTKFTVENSNLYLVDAEGKERKLKLREKIAKSGALTPATLEAAAINIYSNPELAEIVVDGRIVGTTPVTMLLASGKHDIQVSLEGWKRWSETVNLPANSFLRLPVSLQKDRK